MNRLVKLVVLVVVLVSSSNVSFFRKFLTFPYSPIRE